MKIIKYLLICAAALFVAACSCKKEGAEPADIVTGFHKALTSLEFEKASELCCTEEANEYVETFAKAHKEAVDNDSGATAIAVGMLCEAEMAVNDVERNKDTRTVSYTIGDGRGNTKEKIAVLKEVEGEWKIAEIKDK